MSTNTTPGPERRGPYRLTVQEAVDATHFGVPVNVTVRPAKILVDVDGAPVGVDPGERSQAMTPPLTAAQTGWSLAELEAAEVAL